ncbi:MAG: histidine kinase N-terminal 7TM domain-containing protein [Anaerolineae bacterium]|nr:MAG: histidine kinase N-terminal 7TM domain-containing protein [Anaerolineae bacterium]
MPVIVQILNAGNAITAFSLLFYALTFNLRERSARILALLLGCLAIVYATDVLAGTAVLESEKMLWLRVQWLGISFVPAAYMHLSDALLAATGRPSRGRRHWVIRAGYLLSFVAFVLAALTPMLVGDLAHVGPIAYLTAGPLFIVFAMFYIASLSFTGVNLWRAYHRCLTKVSRRRMRYLMFGALAPFLGTFPFLTATGGLVPQAPTLTWSLLIGVNLLVAVQMVLMSYAVAYFGVSFPDRVVKSRLFQWILRGPVVASATLAITVLVNRAGLVLGLENSRAVPFAMVATILALQFLITLVRPTVERWLFYGQDRHDVERLHLLEERLLTSGDLRQYLESILNAACDLTSAPSGFVAVVGNGNVELAVSVGQEEALEGELPPILLPEDQVEIENLGSVFRWDRYWLTPLHAPDSDEVAGILGLRTDVHPRDLEPEEIEGLSLLRERATVALTNRALQKDVFSAVDRLVPLVEEIQRMRSAARYGNLQSLALPLEEVAGDAGLADLVKEALGHYWGGPRLTESPLLGLRVVRDAMQDHDGNAVNALRSILLRGIDQVRPEGERRFTGEWMLYNILEMKFLQGRKVRDVAMRLAMSEADLYRKQKVAIESVAKAMVEMEREATMSAQIESGS